MGWESELVANPTKNLTLRLGVSYSKRQREIFFNEVYTYFNAHTPEWRRLAGTDAALNALIDRELATAYESLEDMATLQNNPFGSRPYKANITGRYKFKEGKLRGLLVGGAARYQSKALTKYSSLDGRPLWGAPTLFADWFVGHRFKVPQLNLPLSLHLNVRNAFNSYLAGVGRRNIAENGLLRFTSTNPAAPG